MIQRDKLHSACILGDLALVKRLLSEGADVNFADGEGWSALHYAAAKGRAEVARILIDAGADLKAQSSKVGRTPLHLACDEERGFDVALMLIEAGADMNAMNRFGLTPFDMPNGRSVREYYESRLAEKVISETFASGPAADGAITSRRGLSL